MADHHVALTDLDVWVFQRDDGGEWTWRRLSPDRELLLESPRSFQTMEDCARDAARHGYSGSMQ
jgi:hypothetical protein